MSDPSTLEPTPGTDLEVIPEIVAHLRAAFETRRTRPLEWRREQVRRVGSMLRDHGDELLGALHADLGKPPLEAWTSDIGIVSGEAKRIARRLPRWMRPERVPTPLEQRPGRSRIVREPLGVALIVSPWNYPLQLLLLPALGALAAGNCVLLKPSEITPHTSALVAKLVRRHLDPDCVAVVEGGVPETTALLEQRFDSIFYTGNGRVGRVVMEAAARHLTPVTLELGGKSPCIVDETADLDVAARRIAWGKFVNAGQTCVAPDYVLVHEAVEVDLAEKLETVLQEFYGQNPQKSPDYGRIVNARHHQRLVGLLKDRGRGRIVVGGHADEEDLYLAPTLVREADPESALMAEEIFGPILPLMKVRNLDDAIAFVARREKPLALYLFSSSKEAAARVLERTSSGGVCVNGTLWQVANTNLPFGGVGASGMGAYHGRQSFETFSHRRGVVTRSTRSDPKFVYPPYTALKTRLIKRFL